MGFIIQICQIWYNTGMKRAGMLLAAGLLVVVGQARAFYSYEEMGSKAGGFVEKSGLEAGKMIFDNSKFDPKQDNVPRVFGFVTSLTDDQVSQIVGSMDLKYVDKVYVAFSGQNEIQLWARSLVANVRFKYDQKAGVDVEIDGVKMGIFNVPGKWFVGADKPLEELVSKLLIDLKQKYSLEVLEVWTENGKIIFRTRVTNLDWLVKT